MDWRLCRACPPPPPGHSPGGPPAARPPPPPPSPVVLLDPRELWLTAPTAGQWPRKRSGGNYDDNAVVATTVTVNAANVSTTFFTLKSKVLCELA